jgi:phytol kinase
VDLLDRFVPDARTLAILVPATVVYTFLAATLAGWLRTARGVRAPFTRKVFHFCIFTIAVLVHLAFGTPGVAVYGTIVALAVVYATMRGDGFPFYEAMARPSDAPRRTLFILVPLITTALGGALGNVVFGDFAMVGYLVAGWGDAVGEPVGTRWGRHRYRVPSLAGVPSTRSLEGSAAVLLLGTLAAASVLLAWGHDVGTALTVGAACGVAGALTEAVSTHGLDNFTVQMMATAVAYWLL